MTVFPYAKINIGLRITAKRADGYHDIETVFHPTGLHDALEFVAMDDPGEDILVTTGIETGAAGADNLVIKAVKILREEHPFPALRIHLHKAIPAGAGLGGGSSDAAFILKEANKAFSIGLSDNELRSSALRIGSDCPFFIEGKPAYATGRGEILQPERNILEGYYIVLLNPGLHISTKEAYANCIPAEPKQRLPELLSEPLHTWKDNIFNDFEAFAFSKFPLIGELKNELYKAGAIFSLMSGSGSSVFGIFRNKPELDHSLKKYLIWEGRSF